MLTILLAASLADAAIDASKLPPPVSGPVDFTRDIKPIFEASCLRCHGPEKPRSGFRLDNRSAALKGGDNGVDIVPGKSAESALVQYIARLVPDLEMPPEGKGVALTSREISLVRAWIDQGAVWEQAPPTNIVETTVSPTFGWTSVTGDKHKFREHYWRREGFDSGLEHFEIFQQTDPDTRVTVAGHALFNDYKVTLDLDRNDLGFIHSGVEQYRRYYDDTGGFDPSSGQLPQSLGADLHLDQGRAWIDLGLTLPRWPKIVLGYEYDYKRGEEATTSWGANGVPGNSRNLAPAARFLDEGTHLLKFDLDGEIDGFVFQDQFRGEFYKLNSSYGSDAARGGVLQQVNQSDHYFQGANSVRLERKLKEWLYGSAGYFYSKLDSEESFADTTITPATMYLASVPQVVLTRESHVFNLNGLVGPWHGLTASLGAQSEWTRQDGFGSGNLNRIPYLLPPSINLTVNPATLSARYDQRTVSETAGLRYSKIPFTALFADARLQQQTIGQLDSESQPGGSYLDYPAFDSRISDLHAGFNTSPWRSVALNAHYRRYEDDSRYKTNQVPQPLGGYPGLLSWRDLLTHEFETKLVLHPFTWLKAALSYQLVNTKYKQDTRPAFDPVSGALFSPGGGILAGEYDSQIYSVGLTLSPWRRFSISGSFSYEDTKTRTASGGLVPPY
ncbi:MAG TPA: c-type cytochrome domain-containing protein, partial [Verrucomicrobiae bacterium]|nr:c-type cytochrome domain-containing protein [Verrucomicrobiae bacterium]